MSRKGLCLVPLVLLAGLSLAQAQDALSTQQQITLGGSDRRGLPSPALLPPPFGSALFSNVAMTPPAPTPLAAMPASAATAGVAPGTDPRHPQALSAGTAPTLALTPTAFGRANNDPTHVMQPGDAVNVQLYGAVTIDAPSTVNANGDIFVPTVGPIRVAGITAGSLQSAVSGAVQKIYVQNVKAYATLISAIPVTIFVAGPVVRPGQYAASSTDSVIAALQYAGGIDPNAGSYRDIKILRGGQVAGTVDLYDFLIDGHLPSFTFQNGDTVVVGPVGPSFAASGTVRGKYRYELKTPYTGSELITLAHPRPDATHAGVTGIRAGRPVSYYMPIADFAKFALEDGDIVRFAADIAGDQITVTIDGRVDGPTTLVLPRTATLRQALAYIPVQAEFADTSSVYLRRASVAVAQKKAIQDSLFRLQASIAAAPVSSDSDASIRTQEGALLDKFAQSASQVQPEGRVIVSRQGKVGDLRLEDGDVIVVPARTDLVNISGEVAIPQAIVWDDKLDISDYLELAGGVTERGKHTDIIVQRASGEIIVGSSTHIHAGDQIIVLPEEPSNTLPILKDITAVIYQIAVGVGVALRL